MHFAKAQETMTTTVKLKIVNAHDLIHHCLYIIVLRVLLHYAVSCKHCMFTNFIKVNNSESFDRQRIGTVCL